MFKFQSHKQFNKRFLNFNETSIQDLSEFLIDFQSVYYFYQESF